MLEFTKGKSAGLEYIVHCVCVCVLTALCSAIELLLTLLMI